MDHRFKVGQLIPNFSAMTPIGRYLFFCRRTATGKENTCHRSQVTKTLAQARLLYYFRELQTFPRALFLDRKKL